MDIVVNTFYVMLLNIVMDICILLILFSKFRQYR